MRTTATPWIEVTCLILTYSHLNALHTAKLPALMTLQENVSLQAFNTFGLAVNARWFVEVHSEQELIELFREPGMLEKPRFILGGGSNILFTKDFDGLVVKINITGKNRVSEDDDNAYVRVGAGEVWHEFVLWSIEQGLSGIENLSLIPGCVGAAPMQNIGAYGVELKNVFHELEAVFPETGEIRRFSAEECRFGYRESVFKRELKNKCIITSVTLRLNKTPQLNTSYGAIEAELQNMGVTNPSVRDISNAVISIRQSKLPNPAEIGNAGSFFKNPVIPTSQYDSLKSEYPEIVGYPNVEGHTKVAAGWLIEHAGWKGKTIDTYGVHKRQALVLVNYGGSQGQDIWNLSQQILDSVKDKYGIALEREVNIM